MATKENEAKKQFLRSYQTLLRRKHHIEQEIEAIRSQWTGRAITYSDMPKGTDQHDLSDFAVEVDDLLRELEAIKWKAINQYHLISISIESMEDEREKDLMRLKYLQGYTWEQVSDEMTLELRWVYRLHGRALSHLTMLDHYENFL